MQHFEKAPLCGEVSKESKEVKETKKLSEVHPHHFALSIMYFSKTNSQLLILILK